MSRVFPMVVVAGHICLDITPALQSGCDLGALLRPGRLVHVGPADVHTGGCVANAGLALQKLGVPTRLIARVGMDAFGALIRDAALASGADCALIEDSQSATSYSVVLAPPDVDRIFLHHAGANERFLDTDVPDEALQGAKLLNFGYPSLMPALYRDHGEPLRRLFTRAHGLGLATSLDMTAIDPASEAARVDWPAFLRNVLPAVDCFLPSAEELCAMLAPTQHAQWLERANGRDVTACLDIATDVSPLAEEILALGAKIAVVKCGARGLLYRIAEKSALATMPFPLDIAAWASRSGFQPAFRLERVVSATGAGDVSIAAFLASLLSGLPPEACARRAAASGACCVEVCDALSGVPSFAQLDRRIAQGWTTVSTAAE